MKRMVPCLLLLTLAVGCAVMPTREPREALPSYTALVERYNRNLAGLDRLWARAVVEVNWKDRRDHMRYEQGDSSTFMMVGDDHLALSVGKLGETLFWIGCDPQRYWYFDLMDQRVAYVGRHDLFAQHESTALPLQIRPLDLPKLLGFAPLDPYRVPAAPQVVVVDGKYVIAPPGSGSRVTIDPDTALPVKIELFDRDRGLVATATLGAPAQVELFNVAMGGWPRIMTRVRIDLAGGSDWMAVHLSDMTDARAPEDANKDRALKNAFTFERLVSGLNVAKVVDLDEP